MQKRKLAQVSQIYLASLFCQFIFGQFIFGQLIFVWSNRGKLANRPAIPHKTSIEMPEHQSRRAAIRGPRLSQRIHFCMGRALI
jgi:hypothetical protein